MTAMETDLHILIAEDAAADAALCERELRRGGVTFELLRVDRREDYERALAEFRPDLILSDFSMPTFDGMAALRLARERLGDIPFIFVSGTIGEDRAVEAMRAGATDYVLKDRLERLVPVTKRALQEAQERRAARQAEQAFRESEERFRSVMQHLPARAAIRDLEGRFQFVNETWERVTAMKAEAALGRRYEDILSAEYAAAAKAIDEEVVRTGRAVSRTFQETAARGGRWWFSTHFPIRDAGGRVSGTATISIDVTEQKEQEAKIARLSRIREVLSGINSAIVRIRDRQELVTEACRIAAEQGGFGLAWIGSYDSATGDVTPIAWTGEGSDSLKQHMATARADVSEGHGSVGRAIRERRPVFTNDLAAEVGVGGRRRQAMRDLGYRSLIALPLIVEESVAGVLVLFTKEPGFFNDEELKLLTELSADISFALDHIGKEERLNYLAYYDALTGLPNRTLFHERVSQLIHAAGPGSPGFAVVVLDAERFRSINETLGVAAGDHLLGRIAERLSQAVGDDGSVARISADQFAAMLGGARSGTDVAHVLEQRIFAALNEPFPATGQDLRIPFRAGIAMYPADGATAETLFINAEAALAKAKESGERFLFYAAQMNARVAERLRLENALRRAVREEQFVLHYQPRIELATGQLCGFEALIRWRHPERGLVPPGEFIPILEDTGLIFDAGRWALRRAVLDHAAWRTEGLNAQRIAVNISAIHLKRKDFIEDIQAALSAADGSGANIDIELTESMLMEDVEGNIQKLKTIRAMGLQVAIDDFGTGYCSLSYLAKLPIDSLKIDRSFVSQIARGPEQMALVSTVISLARALNLKVVAEGVETDEQANLLRLLRCDEAQGYLFGRPEPLEKVRRLIAQREG
jgi:diguanylate cyclase (GGDEF)-like protein/PAS domain S-box-containing protein